MRVKRASTKLNKFLNLTRFDKLLEVLEEDLGSYVIDDGTNMTPRSAIDNFLEWAQDYQNQTLIVYSHQPTLTDFYIPWDEYTIADSVLEILK